MLVSGAVRWRADGSIIPTRFSSSSLRAAVNQPYSGWSPCW